MPTPTYTPIASASVSSPTSSITFSNLNTIAAGMRDLILIINIQTVQETNLRITFNGITGTSYANIQMWGDGTNPGSASNVNQPGVQDYYVDTPATNFATYLVSIFDFSQTDKNKPILIRSNRTNDAVGAVASRFASNDAITSIAIQGVNVNLNTGSNAQLYGVIA